MSHLTSDVNVVHVAVLYDRDDKAIDEGYDCYTYESAIECAKEMVANAVDETGEYHSAKIETRVLPVYK